MARLRGRLYDAAPAAAAASETHRAADTAQRPCILCVLRHARTTSTPSTAAVKALTSTHPLAWLHASAVRSVIGKTKVGAGDDGSTDVDDSVAGSETSETSEDDDDGA